MADAELKQLKAEAGQLKAQFTRFEKFLAQEQNLKTSNDDMLKMRLCSLEKTLYDHRKLQLKINILTGKTEDSDFIDDDLEERYYAIFTVVNNLLSQSGQCNVKHNSVKLPHLDIPKFTGEDVTKYRPFIELFQAVIGRDTELAPVQKLCYLRKYLGKEAETLIESLPLVDSSYNEALTLLKNRYNNKSLLVTSHVNNLLDYPSIIKGTAHNLRDLVSNVRQQLGALRNMGQPVDSWDMLLLPILLRKLDQFTSRAFHSERDKGTLPKLSDLLTFLEDRASSFEESVNSSCQNNYKFKSKVVLPALVHKECNFCSKSETHKLYNCPKFKMASVNDRCNYVKANNLCMLCLNAHGNNPCKFKFKCSLCSAKNHNTLLHNVEEVALVSNNNMASFGNSTVLLPTVKLNIACVDGTYMTVRALLDSGSQTSFVTTDVVDKLTLKTFKRNINISTLGRQSCTVSKCVVININSMNNSYSQDVMCSVVDKITSPLPQQEYKLDSFNIPHGIMLADKDFYVPEEISMLLAADVFFDVVLSGQLSLGPNGPQLLNTKFGYVVAGELKNNTCGMSSSSSINTSVSNVMHCMPCHQEDDLAALLEKFWEVEALPPAAPAEKSNARDTCPVTEAELCEAAFKSSVKLIDAPDRDIRAEELQLPSHEMLRRAGVHVCCRVPPSGYCVA